MAAAGCVALGLGAWMSAASPADGQSFSLGTLDETAGKTCRSILAVINPASTALEITSTLRIGDANAVVITYVARPQTGLPKGRKLVCSFKDSGGTFRRSRDLVAVTSDGGPLGPARMRFLQRFWVGSIEAEAAAAKIAAKPKP
ncbi:MAG: hypothetical protein C0511_01555 [Hyphomicrobium sp.]|nr:hypothetical protein [Hyphomicrobium sp.]